MKTFLRELEAILASSDEAGRESILESVRGLLRALSFFSGSIPLSRKAIGFLIADLTMWRATEKTGAQVMAKVGELAKLTGPHVYRIFQAL